MEDIPEIRRKAFLEALAGAVATTRLEGTHLGLLLIDVTNLASINHYHGYQYGDLLLAGTMEHLLSVSKLADTVFRVGDHRFAFLLPSLSNPAFITLALGRVNSILEQKLFMEAEVISADVKIGVAINRGGETDAMTMLAMAESSVALVKGGRSLRLEGLLEGKQEETTDFQLENRFADALQHNDLQLHYQPKINLVTGQVTGVEALLRWTPEGGEPVAPELIVELADTSGQAYKMTKWLVHTALRQAKAWEGNIDLGVALNVQASLVGNAELPSMFQDSLAIWGTAPAGITVEITESALIEDMKSGFEILSALRELGIKLSIDDFGTGYSSLSYFKYVPAGELKIDRSFISSMLRDVQDMELVKIMIHIAHQFNMTVVAEGVEDRNTLDELRRLGCDFAQGYYFSKPLVREELEAWVKSWPGLPVL